MQQQQQELGAVPPRSYPSLAILHWHLVCFKGDQEVRLNDTALRQNPGDISETRPT